MVVGWECKQNGGWLGVQKMVVGRSVKKLWWGGSVKKMVVGGLNTEFRNIFYKLSIV